MPSSRVLRAGVVAGATGAALLVAPPAAHAAPSAGPPVVAPGGTVTVTDPAAAYPATAAVQLSSPACAAKVAPATTAGVWTPVVTNRSATSVAFTVPATGPATGPNGAVKAYNACVYDTAATTGVLLGATTVYLGSAASVSPASGLTGGGNTVTVTARADAPMFTGVTAVGASFTTGACGSGPANLVATNVTRQSNTAVSLTVPAGVVTAAGAPSTGYSICVYDGAGALLTVVPYTANLAAVTPGAGSYTSSNAAVLTSPQPYLTGISAPAALLVAGTSCPAAYSATAGTPVTGSGVRRLTNNRLVVNVPPLPLVGNQATLYQLCAYAGANGGALIASAGWTAAAAANPTSITPSAGPAAGGSTITVLGTDFPTEPGRITATLGGVPLTNIQVISDRAFTAQTPPHPVEDNVALVVTTPLGTRTLTAAYSFLNPVRISPNTAPSSAGAVEILVQGTGFLSVPFGSTGNAARVFLVNGVYNGADDGMGGRVNAPVAECLNVLPLSDEELVCTLQLGRRLNAAGTGFFDPVGYTNMTDPDVMMTTGSRVVTSPGGKFSRNDVGQVVTSPMMPAIPPGTTVAAVLSPTRALLSAPATMTGGGQQLTIGGQPVRTVPLTTTAGSATVGGTFTKADIGRTINGMPAIPAGSTILAVGTGGGTATISAPATLSSSVTVNAATDGSNTITSSAFTGTETLPAFVGANTLGVPVGTQINSFAPGNAQLPFPAPGTATGSLTVTRPVNGMLYPGSPVPDGSYHLTVVSNGQSDAAVNDPGYTQTDVTSSSSFTVAPF